MELQQNEPIQIVPVGNGFFVRPPHDFSRRESSTSNDQVLVFQSFAGLSAWLEKHFSHRDEAVTSDPRKGEA